MARPIWQILEQDIFLQNFFLQGYTAYTGLRHTVAYPTRTTQKGLKVLHNLNNHFSATSKGRERPHDPLCKLCNSAPETPAHLCKDCPYTSAVWTHVVRWLDLQQLPASTSTSTVYRWWKMCRKVFSKEQKPAFDGLMMYFWQNIWKERNRRIFQQESKKVVDVAYLIKEDIHLHQAATGLKRSS